MTVTGSGYANCSIRSIVPAPSTASSRPSTIACTSERRRSTIFGVKALLTSPRSRVWSGGSRSSIEKPIAGTAAPNRAATNAAIGSLTARASRSVAITSS